MENAKVNSIDCNGITIEYEVIHRNRKTISLQITREGKVRILSPLFFDDAEIEKLLFKKAEWITDSLKKVKVSLKARKRSFVSGETILFLGREVPIKIVEVANRGVSVSYNGRELAILISRGINKSDERCDRIRTVILLWYRNRAREKLQERTEVYSEIMGYRPRKIFIKEQKTRWGSCSGRGNINYNWKLIMANENIIDYVVVHELAHLKHPNHSKAFWNYVENVMPDYVRREKWLNANGLKLDI